MSTRPPTVTTALLLAAATLALYAARLDYVPAHLAHDEVFFALHAHAIAATGRDLQGVAMPLYFPILNGYWAQPVIIYFTALFLKFLPISETVVRLPTVVVCVTDVVLMYFVGRRFFRAERPAIFAAATLALTPTHFILGRMGVDPLYPIPFVLIWLLCLLGFEDDRRSWRLVLGMIALGAGLYTYIGALVTMPICVALTWIALLAMRTPLKTYAFASLAFAVLLVPLGVWLAAHPAAYSQFLGRYELYDAAHSGATGSTNRFFGMPALIQRLDVYWSCLNPVFLFLVAEDNPVNSTFRSGVFLLPLALFVPLGLFRIAGALKTPRHLVLLLGFFASPLAAVIVGERTVARQQMMLPFAVLIATIGVEWALAAARRWRAAALCLIVLMPLQFGLFYFDYFHGYRIRSASWFDRNIRGAAETIVARAGDARDRRIYLADNIQWLDWYWRFYTLKQHREDLLERTSEFDPRARWAIDSPSVVLTPYDPPRHDAHARDAGAIPVATIREPDGEPSFSIFEK
jgi:4-amino-4-deoxy-L-arabinose transferase-like glycosyltransferase